MAYGVAPFWHGVSGVLMALLVKPIENVNLHPNQLRNDKDPSNAITCQAWQLWVSSIMVLPINSFSRASHNVQDPTKVEAAPEVVEAVPDLHLQRNETVSGENLRCRLVNQLLSALPATG